MKLINVKLITVTLLFGMFINPIFSQRYYLINDDFDKTEYIDYNNSTISFETKRLGFDFSFNGNSFEILIVDYRDKHILIKGNNNLHLILKQETSELKEENQVRWDKITLIEGNYDLVKKEVIKGKIGKKTNIKYSENIKEGDSSLNKLEFYSDLFWNRKKRVYDKKGFKMFESSDYYNCNDYGRSVQQTNDGEYIILGNFGTKELGDYDGKIGLIKTNGSGDKLWSKKFGISNYTLYGVCVQKTKDGGYIILGKTNNKGYLIKTDGNGLKQWEQFVYKSGRSDWGKWTNPSGLVQTNDGGYVIIGHCNFNCHEMDKKYVGCKDIFLKKTDKNGVPLWEKTFGGIDGEIGYSVQQTNDGGFILLGKSYSFGNKERLTEYINKDYSKYIESEFSKPGTNQTYLIKTDESGNEQWSKTFGGRGFDEGESIQETTDGGYIITGTTSSFGGKNKYGEKDKRCRIFLLKINENGKKQW